MQVFEISVEPMERVTFTGIQSERRCHAQLLQLECAVRFVHEHVARQKCDDFCSPELQKVRKIVRREEKSYLSWSRFNRHGQFEKFGLIFVLFVCL